MTTFTVEWTIEIEARTPEEAARAAYQRILAKAHGVTFDVYADPTTVDLGSCYHKVDLAPDSTSGPAVGFAAVQAELDKVCAELDAEAAL